MDTIDLRRYEMLKRVREFGAAHAAAFPAGSVGAQMFAKISEAVVQLDDLGMTEAMGHSDRRTGTTTKATAMAALRETLEAMSLTARALAADTPGVEDRFRLPQSRHQEKLVTAARSFLHEAEPLSAAFIAHGMPQTFVADLQAQIDAFVQAAADQWTAKMGHASARADYSAAVGAALGVVQRLDAIVWNALRKDVGAMTMWRAARRVQRVQASAGESTPAAGPATPAVPTAPGSSASAFQGSPGSPAAPRPPAAGAAA